MKKMLQIMKKTLFVLICITISIAAQAQSNFAIADGKLVWQKVYETDKNLEEIADALFNTGKLQDIGIANERITCKIIPCKIDISGAGFSRGTVPMYLVLNDFTAFVAIQAKEGRYRVTLERMDLIGNTNAGLSTVGDVTELDFYAIKKGELTKAVTRYMEPIIGRQLDILFSLTESSILDNDNW